ncbi:hypothetical protein ACFQX4_24435 [Roseomonas sp. GCM10028921]
MAERQGDAEGRWRLEAEMEPCDHPGRDVDRQGQPGPAKWAPVGRRDHDHLGQRVINLDQAERLVGSHLPDYPPQPVARVRGAMPTAKHLPLVVQPYPSGNGLVAWRPELYAEAAPPDFAHEVSNARPRPGEVELLYG